MPHVRLRHLLPVAVFLALPLIVHADEFSEFRIPANHYLDWTGGLNGSTFWSHQTVGPERSSNHETRGTLATAATSWSETDTRVSSWAASLRLDGDSRRQDMLRYFPTGTPQVFDRDTDANRGRMAQESGSLQMDQAWYPNGGPLALVASASARAFDGQSWQRDQNMQEFGMDPLASFLSLSSEARQTYVSILGARAGLGYGRVRNATGVFEARVLEDRLRQSGALARPLSPGARQRLANLMYARSDLDQVLSRPAEPVMEAVERIVREDGALGDSALTAAELFRLTEAIFRNSLDAYFLDPDALPKSPFARLSGWSVSATIGTDHSRSSFRDDEAYTSIAYSAGSPLPPNEARLSSSGKVTHDQTSLSLELELHRPAGMRSQWDLFVTDAMPLSRESRGFSTQGAVTWRYIVADRWLASAGASHSRQVWQDHHYRTLNDTWGFGLNGSVAYLLVDHATLGLTFNQNWSERHGDFYFTNVVDPRAAEYRNGGSVTVDITYRFKGSARIAGVYPQNTGN